MDVESLNDGGMGSRGALQVGLQEAWGLAGVRGKGFWNCDAAYLNIWMCKYICVTADISNPLYTQNKYFSLYLGRVWPGLG